jgi:secreted trypsin-like serine protease
MPRPALALALWLCLCASAAALVGGATVVRDTGAGRHIVMIVSTRANLCTGTALARDLVLTAAHCVAPAATYRVLTPDVAPPGLPVRSIAVHPRYNPKDYAGGRVTADVALIKLDAPLPDKVAPAALAENRAVAPGDRFTVAGYGVTAPGSDAGAGVPRQAALVATGRPGNLQIRLVDPAARNERAGLGACTGDSGAPAFVERQGIFAVIGVVSWSTGPAGTDGCGGMTGITPLSLHRGWIAEQARKMGSVLGR